MKRMLRRTILAILVAVPSAQSVAEPSEAVRWLMDQPLTLMDIGIIRLEERAFKAVQEMDDPDLGSEPHISVDYDWDQNALNVRFFDHSYTGAVSHDACNRIRWHFSQHLLGFDPDLIDPQSDTWIKPATNAISGWFSHAGWQSADRDKDIGQQLSQVIFVHVTLVQPAAVYLERDHSIDGWPPQEIGFSCRGRILQVNVPSSGIVLKSGQ